MALAAPIVLCVAQLGAAREGLMGGGAIQPNGECTSAAERATVEQLVAAHRATVARGLGLPEQFTFYPLGGLLYRDLFTTNFVDLMPGTGLLDWDCTDFTYDGHDATDVLLRSFGEQLVGVPVFAALDGIVIAAHDDEHTACSGIANYVLVDHGAGRVCYYFHLRKDSVQVGFGQPVSAGQQLGLAASSGCSTWPHLHFATYDDGVLVEPYTGACNPGQSQWTEQTPIERDLYLNDLNLTNVNISGYPGLPFDMPRRGTFVQGVRAVRFWIQAGNLPASSTWRVRFVRPDGSTAVVSGPGSFGNPSYHWSWWWWSFSVNLDTVGVWHLRLNVNGATMAEVPFDVVATAEEIVNRPPAPVEASLFPARPHATDVLQCRLEADLLLDDPDYDLVRYRYVWRVDGAVVRDVVSAGHSDALARGVAPAGSFVTCEVTPSDGTASAASTVVGELIRPFGKALPMPGPDGEAHVRAP